MSGIILSDLYVHVYTQMLWYFNSDLYSIIHRLNAMILNPKSTGLINGIYQLDYIPLHLKIEKNRIFDPNARGQKESTCCFSAGRLNLLKGLKILILKFIEFNLTIQ